MMNINKKRKILGKSIKKSLTLPCYDGTLSENRVIKSNNLNAISEQDKENLSAEKLMTAPSKSIKYTKDRIKNTNNSDNESLTTSDETTPISSPLPKQLKDTLYGLQHELLNKPMKQNLNEVLKVGCKKSKFVKNLEKYGKKRKEKPSDESSQEKLSPSRKRQHLDKSSLQENRTLRLRSQTFDYNIIESTPVSSLSSDQGYETNCSNNSSRRVTPDNILSRNSNENKRARSRTTQEKDSCYNIDDDDVYFTDKDLKSQGNFQKNISFTSRRNLELLKWSEDSNEFLTICNFMTSWRQNKAKYPHKLNEKVLNRHPELEEKYRAMVLDWMMEVCDEFKLQKSTFYLAQSYLDFHLALTGISPSELSSYVRKLAKKDRNQSPETIMEKIQKNANKELIEINQNTGKQSSKIKGAETTVGRSVLQLLGITSLFLAAKIEEIDPPSIDRMAYITDGCCNREDIALQEHVLLQTLDWKVHPVTAYDWLRLYLQTTYFYFLNKRERKERERRSNSNSLANVSISSNNSLNLNENVEVPKRKTRLSSSSSNNNNNNNIPEKTNQKSSKTLQNLEVTHSYIGDRAFKPLIFAQMCHLLDLATLDINSLQFKPHVLAASVLFHFSSEKTIKSASNLQREQIFDCIAWLTPMAITLKDHGLIKKPTEYADRIDREDDYRSVPANQWFNLQIHQSNMLMMLEKSKEVRRKRELKSSFQKCSKDSAMSNNS